MTIEHRMSQKFIGIENAALIDNKISFLEKFQERQEEYLKDTISDYKE